MVETTRSEPAAAPSIAWSRTGMSAWALLVAGLVMMVMQATRVAGTFAAVLGTLACCYVVERASGRRHGYLPSATRR